jgi:Lrp/AsnC family leucine-responsive transcriptional regulator
MERLDAFDFKILDELKVPGAIAPNVTFLAKKLNKPIATIHGRLRRLEGRGVVKNYVPIISHRKTGTEIMSFVLLQASSDVDLNDYGMLLSKMSEISEVYYLVGRWDFLCKIRAKDMDNYMSIISKINREASPVKMEDIIVPKSFKTEI